MAVFTLSIEPLSIETKDEFRWCLDEPIHSDSHEGNILEKDGLRIKGWFLKKKNTPANLVLVDGFEITPLALNSTRSDVIAKVVTPQTQFDDSPLCGFDHIIIPKTPKLSIAIAHDSQIKVIYEISIEGVFKILEGEQNWLFLDNDTNESVEQFTGKTQLSRKEKKSWLDYIDAFNTLPLSLAGKSAFLVAPSKEFVLEEHYPFKKSKQTPLDQLIDLAGDTFSLITPISPLKNAEKRTFRVCDTHWSCHGARIATMEVVKQFEIESTPIDMIFSKDVYVERLMAGDLGSKTYPIQRHREDFLTTFNYNRVVVYDNNLPNFGRTFILDNPDALYEQTLLVFGSSSVYSMFNYLARIFKTVVFFHTAGNLDKELVEKIAPDYLLAQSNARFVIKAPSFDIKISDYIEDKKRRLTHIPDVIYHAEKNSPTVNNLTHILGAIK